MAGRRQHQIDAEARKNWARYQEAIQLARQWMRETDSNQRGLAERLGETEASVSKFMSGTLEHAPCRYRKAKMRMLERIEDLCTNPTTITDHNKYVQNVAEMTDERFWAILTDQRAKLLLNEPFSGRALVRFRTSYVEALHGPIPERYYICANVLLYMSEVIARMVHKPSDHALCSKELLRKSHERAIRLRDVALAGFKTLPQDWNPAEEEARAIGYAGHCTACMGVLLDQPELLAKGVSEMGKAATMPHRKKSWLWPNLLLFLDRLFETSEKTAVPFSMQVGELARKDLGSNLIWTLTTRDLPHILDHWRIVAPEVVSAAGL